MTWSLDSQRNCSTQTQKDPSKIDNPFCLSSLRDQETRSQSPEFVINARYPTNLDTISTFHCTCKESSKGSDKRRKECKYKCVQLNWRNVYSVLFNSNLKRCYKSQRKIIHIEGERQLQKGDKNLYCQRLDREASSEVMRTEFRCSIPEMVRRWLLLGSPYFWADKPIIVCQDP